MKTKLIFAKKSKKFTNRYYTIYFHGFRPLSLLHPFFFNNDAVTHILGFRFTKGLCTSEDINYNEGGRFGIKHPKYI